MKQVLVIGALTLLLSSLAAAEAQKPKPVQPAAQAAASDPLGECIAEGWQACGIVCGDGCTLQQLFACQDEITAACNAQYGNLETFSTPAFDPDKWRGWGLQKKRWLLQ
jgi:hypothetical protein